MRISQTVTIVAAALLLGACNIPAKYDVCVYGGTSAGVVAAYSAAQMGLDVVLVEPTEHIGGMTSGGLGYTDIGNKPKKKSTKYFRESSCYFSGKCNS